MVRNIVGTRRHARNAALGVIFWWRRSYANKVARWLLLHHTLVVWEGRWRWDRSQTQILNELEEERVFRFEKQG